eukprot:3443399-Amphidinium_carterae.1
MATASIANFTRINFWSQCTCRHPRNQHSCTGLVGQRPQSSCWDLPVIVWSTGRWKKDCWLMFDYRVIWTHPKDQCPHNVRVRGLWY